jgi:hypothetical protein
VSAVAALVSLVAAATPVTLTVRYTDGSSAEHVAHLRCRADSARADGFLRDAGAATVCRRARAIASFLATRPSSKRICTQIYGGRQRARITGTIGTRQIDRRLKRTNGCEIGDWQHAVPLVPSAHVGVAP